MHKQVLEAAMLKHKGVLGEAMLMHMLMTGASKLMMECRGWKYALSLMEATCLVEYLVGVPWKETAP